FKRDRYFSPLVSNWNIGGGPARVSRPPRAPRFCPPPPCTQCVLGLVQAITSGAAVSLLRPLPGHVQPPRHRWHPHVVQLFPSRHRLDGGWISRRSSCGGLQQPGLDIDAPARINVGGDPAITGAEHPARPLCSEEQVAILVPENQIGAFVLAIA